MQQAMSGGKPLQHIDLLGTLTTPTVKHGGGNIVQHTTIIKLVRNDRKMNGA